MSSAEPISVGVRLCPLSQCEVDRHDFFAWRVSTEDGSLVRVDRQGFDVVDCSTARFPCGGRVFSAEHSNQSVFSLLAAPLVESAVNGVNGTVFAYGQTGSGKTHSMRGTADDPGLVPLAMDHLFDQIRKCQGRRFLLRASCLEIYQERVRDLLRPESGELTVFTDDDDGVHLRNLSEEIVRSAEQCIALAEQAEQERHYGETAANERSSRSHVVFRVVVESEEERIRSSKEEVRVSTLTFVDLAGSERVGRSGSRETRAAEGKCINKSLLFLGIVISKLSSGDKHIPFRDSSLTRILQPSLGGNSRTAILCTISPAASDIHTTVSTLRFAARAVRVRNNARVNLIDSRRALIHQHKKQMRELEREISSLELRNDDREPVEARESHYNDENLHEWAENTKSLEAEARKNAQQAAAERALAAAEGQQVAKMKKTLELKLQHLQNLILMNAGGFGTEKTQQNSVSRSSSRRRITISAANTSSDPSFVPNNSSTESSSRMLNEDEKSFYKQTQMELRIQNLHIANQSLNYDKERLMIELSEAKSVISRLKKQLDRLCLEIRLEKESNMRKTAKLALLTEGIGLENLSADELEKYEQTLQITWRKVIREASLREVSLSSNDRGVSDPIDLSFNDTMLEGVSSSSEVSRAYSSSTTPQSSFLEELQKDKEETEKEPLLGDLESLSHKLERFSNESSIKENPEPDEKSQVETTVSSLATKSIRSYSYSPHLFLADSQVCSSPKSQLEFMFNNAVTPSSTDRRSYSPKQ